MISITILYDTSYLMSERAELFTNFPLDRTPYIDVKHCIPHEVQVEISRHIKNADDQKKNQLARSARALYAKMIGLQNYTEASLADVSLPAIHENILGPDSDTDKKLIGYAYRLLEKGEAMLVFVATRDAGIGAELVFQATRNGKSVYCDLILQHFFQKVKSITETDFEKDEAERREIVATEREEKRRLEEALAAEREEKRRIEEAAKAKLREEEERARNSCPNGHGLLQIWDGKPRCFTCGWPAK